MHSAQLGTVRHRMEEEERPVTFFEFLHFGHSQQAVVTAFEHLLGLLNHSYESCLKFYKTRSSVYVQSWYRYRPKKNIGQSKYFNPTTAQIVEDRRVFQSMMKLHWMTCKNLFRCLRSSAQPSPEVLDSACFIIAFHVLQAPQLEGLVGNLAS